MSTTCVGAHRHWMPMNERMDYITQKTFETYIKTGTLGVKMHARKHRQNLKPTVVGRGESEEKSGDGRRGGRED